MSLGDDQWPIEKDRGDQGHGSPVQGLLGLLENQPNWAHRDCYVLEKHRTKQIVSGCFRIKQWIHSMHVNHVVAGSFL